MYPTLELFVYERMLFFLGISCYRDDAVDGNNSVVTSAKWSVVIKVEGANNERESWPIFPWDLIDSMAYISMGFN